MKIYLATTIVVFGLIAVLQATRLINRWPVVVGAWNVPLWLSGLAVIVAAGLCLWAICLLVLKARGA